MTVDRKKYTYKRRLGLLNEAMNPPIATTKDGRAWVTFEGRIRMFPDHWGEPNHDCYHHCLMELPSGVEVVLVDGQIVTT